MKSQKSLARKRLKERNRRRDFLKKKNVRRNNWPIPREEVTEPILALVFDNKRRIVFEKGKAKYEVVGKRTLKRKAGKNILIAGEGILPKSKKFKGKKVIKK